MFGGIAVPNLLDPNFWRNLWVDARLAWGLLRDRRVPLHLKSIPLFVILYLISPLDLISGLPVIGQLDDLAILLFGLRLFVRLAPVEIVEEHREMRAGTK
jgi:uncharacterized membrane protein YkvA (DUF1232 family)